VGVRDLGAIRDWYALHKYVLGVVNVQALNMEIAQEQLPRARAMLEKNGRFKDVTPSYTPAKEAL